MRVGCFGCSRSRGGRRTHHRQYITGKLPTTNSTHLIGDGDSTASNVLI